MAVSEKQSKTVKGIKGGKRPGAGRKKGVPNKRTAKLQAEVEASGLTPLEFLLSVMRDVVNEPKDRMAAAIAAAPYVHAKLASVEVGGKDGGAIPLSMTIEFVGARTAP